MGVFRVGTRLASPSNPDTARELEAVVDTGSHYTLVPRTIVEELGIRPTRKMAARLANGIRIVRDMGQAELSYGALSTVTWVVFGNPGDAVLLGAITLQELGLEVDPTTEMLRETEVYMFGVAGPARGASLPSV